MKRLIVFDLDGTLAESKSPLDEEMVAVISGGDWPQFETQVLAQGLDDAGFANLYLLPTCGAKFYTHRTAWEQLCSEGFTGAQKQKIIHALQEAIESLRFSPDKVRGEAIEDRETAGGYPGNPKAKANWFSDAATTIRSWPEVVDVSYSHGSATFGGKVMPYWVDSSAASLAAFKAMGQIPYFA